MGSFIGIFFGAATLGFIIERIVTFALSSVASGVADTVGGVVKPVGVIGTWTGVTWLVGRRDVSKRAQKLRKRNAAAGSRLDSFIERVVKR